MSGAGGGGGDASDRLRQAAKSAPGAEPPLKTGLATLVSSSILSSEVLDRRDCGEGAR